ncbi:MAG: glycoside hydrolase family 97 protein [Terracidiphilus sp.]|nr:glycoside hydrolase family 97 protein [Terracidiphilus sp.]
MRYFRFALVCLMGFLAGSFAVAPVRAQLQEPAAKVVSPSGQIAVLLYDAPGEKHPERSAWEKPGPGEIRYAVEFHGKTLMAPARLGLELAGLPALGPGMHAVAVKTASADESYTIPAGKTKSVRDHWNGATVEMADAAGRKLNVEVRVFDDGAAFRYQVPQQAGLDKVKIVRELTGFAYAKDSVTYPLILPGFQNSYEEEYQLRMASGLHNNWLIGLPLLAQVPDVGWVAITEADIDNYAGMYVKKDSGFLSPVLHAELAPRLEEAGVAVETATPFQSPWRVLMIADEAAKLIESNIVLNLNPPSKIADTSWIVAGKSAWDWWSDQAAPSVSFKTGMNTATMKHYIDFASQAGFRYMLIDAGWALAPERKSSDDYAAAADIRKVVPEVDMQELIRYAGEKHVKLWLWSHWTSVDKYMDEAFPLFEKWGVAGVKIDFMNRDDQWMVNWYRKVIAAAAEHHLMIDYHGAFKPDGLRRTYPNLMTREGVLGKEYLKFSARTTPAHNATLPFTRMLAGPMDYTPGAFGNSNLKNFAVKNHEPMSLGTRAQELALYVVFESPLEMVSDYPERYAGQKEFEFLKKVPATWDEVHAIGGQPMEWVALARKSGNEWYVGALTNWTPREIKVPLDFLGKGSYEAEIWSDAPDAAEEATHTVLTHRRVDAGTVLNVTMAPGGGSAIRIYPAGEKK